MNKNTLKENIKEDDNKSINGAKKLIVQHGLHQEQGQFQQENQGQQRLGKEPEKDKSSRKECVANNISSLMKTFIKHIKKLKYGLYKSYLKDKKANNQLIVLDIYLYLMKIRVQQDAYDLSMKFLLEYINKRIQNIQQQLASQKEIQKWKINRRLVNQVFCLKGKASINNQAFRCLSKQVFPKKEQQFNNNWEQIIKVQMEILQSIHGQNLGPYLEYEQFLSLQSKMEDQNEVI